MDVKGFGGMRWKLVASPLIQGLPNLLLIAEFCYGLAL
jgi:hypothetical protein